MLQRSPMETVKRMAMLLLAGAIAGDIVATLVGPGVVSWYNTSSDASANCNCVTIAHQVTAGLIRVQLIGALCGAVFFLIVGIVISRLRHRPAHPPASPPTPTP